MIEFSANEGVERNSPDTQRTWRKESRDRVIEKSVARDLNESQIR